MNPYTHFYLYAKGWYVKNDLKNDLLTILADYCGMEKKYVAERDLRSVMLEIIWKEMGNLNTFSRFIAKMEEKNFESACMWLLLGVENHSLGKPDKSILPLCDDVTEELISQYDWAD